MPRIDRLASLYLAHPIMRTIGPDPKSRVPILMYHSISENLFGMSHPYFHINTVPAVFVEQMRWLQHSGYRTLSLNEALEGMEAGKDLRKTVVLTFDDGYRDFYTEALPVLKQCGFSATIFLATDRIRETPARIEGADYLTWREVRELHSEGIQFGAHTVTHPDLRSLGPDELEQELGRSKETIEDSLGVRVESFSYPHGFPEEDKQYAEYVRDLLCNLGYDNAVTTILGRAHKETERFSLPRLPINSFDDGAFLRAKLEGGYDWLHWPQLFKKYLFHHAALMMDRPKAKAMTQPF
jgi:peptidoglycan/xylan/chitin deacetylase (PgdA/CDA1 family)